jgi:hypothetical protein
MHKKASGRAAIQVEHHAGWFNWARRHPGVVLLSALAMAILALPKSPKTENTESDASGEEVHLFI